MPISVDEVRHVARLARLAIADQDLPRYAAELGRILEHVARLQALDTADVPPTASAFAVAGLSRPDVSRPGCTVTEALSGAPAHHGGMFLVPRVVDGT